MFVFQADGFGKQSMRLGLLRAILYLQRMRSLAQFEPQIKSLEMLLSQRVRLTNGQDVLQSIMSLLVSVGKWQIKTATRDDRTLYSAATAQTGASFGRQNALDTLTNELDVAPIIGKNDGGLYCLSLGSSLFALLAFLFSFSFVLSFSCVLSPSFVPSRSFAVLTPVS